MPPSSTIEALEMNMTHSPRRRILIVDDEMLIAMLVEQMVEDLGFEAVGPALTLKEGLSLCEQESFDCAILDMNLGHGVQSTPIAQVLQARGIPFLYASGYGSQNAAGDVGGAPVLDKPFLIRDLEAALRRLLP